MPVKEIFVTLHRSRNPQVVLEERDQEAAEGDYIIWYLRRNEGGLKIWDFKADFENVFASQAKGMRHKVYLCTYRPSEQPSEDKFEYTLTLKDQRNRRYTTTQTLRGRGPVEGGKPVIRN